MIAPPAQRVVRVKPSDMVQKLLRLNGAPFSIKDYPYLIPIYDTNCPEVGLFTARQIAKSTTLASKMVLEACFDPPGSNQVLVTPLQEQAYVFATQRLRDFIHESPLVKRGFFSGPQVVDQMLRKQFNNGNMVSLGYAQRTADRLRGRSAGKIKFDEVQDIFPEVIPVVKEMAFRVGNPNYWYCGTPKSKNNYMEALRTRSTGAEWAVRCPATGCKKWNLRWNEKNIGNKGVICEFCGQPLNTNVGQWVQARKLDRHLGKAARVTMESYRIPQLIVKPIMDMPDKWLELLSKYGTYSQEQFYNEVLGLPFDSGSQPVTMEQLYACCADRPNELPDTMDRSMPPLVMGVDWAYMGENSFTVIIIGGWSSFPSKFKVFYYKVFKGVENDSLFQIKWIEDIFKERRIKLIGADWGAGHVQNLQLINKLSEECVAQMFHTGMKGKGSRNAARAKWEPRSRKWHLARTAVLTDVFEGIRRKQIEFPRATECEELFRHIMAETLEYRPETNTQFYTNADPDDCLHALCYATLAGELLLHGDFRGHLGSAPAPMAGDAWNEAEHPVDGVFYGEDAPYGQLV